MNEQNNTLSVTKHTMPCGDKSRTYQAIAGYMPITEEISDTKKTQIEKDSTEQAAQEKKLYGLKHTADIFFTAYTLEGTDSKNRPIMFAFNGGPGSSSVWLHMGGLGPRKVAMNDDGSMPSPPGELVDNTNTWLDFTDLVFIDPVTTGYSRAIEGDEAKKFREVEKDVETVAEFIRLYLTRYKRWNSPKYLVGESYGTTRAAALAHHLQIRQGIYLNGIIMISSALQFHAFVFDEKNDLAHITILPSYAATAWYHNKLADNLQKQPLEDVVEQARIFAFGEYASALLLGSKLDEIKKEKVIKKYAEMTALTPAYVRLSNLRISQFRFAKELFRHEGTTVGRLDGRVVGYQSDMMAAEADHDPSYVAIQSPYTAVMNHYLRNELEFLSDLPYEILTDRVRPWDFSKFENTYLDVSIRLQTAMMQNKYLKVLFANGYFDLATPFGATEYTINHLELAGDIRKNIIVTYYPSGHMIYNHTPSLNKLTDDVRKFL